MFEGSAKKLKKISSREFMACYEENINLLQSLEGTDDKFVERIIQIQASRQPHVVKYVVDALMEEERDAVLLSDDDRGLIFIILKTVIDALDKQSRK
jgi:nitrogen-specific signal transduction histidine kinase